MRSASARPKAIRIISKSVAIITADATVADPTIAWRGAEGSCRTGVCDLSPALPFRRYSDVAIIFLKILAGDLLRWLGQRAGNLEGALEKYEGLEAQMRN
jgi:hypothetical protein